MNLRAPLSARWLYAVLAAYVLGFAIFWPRVFLVVDEERYVSQAVAFAQGGTTISGAEILHPPARGYMISNYPPGTALLQTPLVWAFGWRGASLLSVLALIVATLVTARWLFEGGRPAAFALVIPGFLGTALFARIAMSDVPSAAIVALTSYVLWRAGKDGWAASLIAGFLVGASLLFREPLIVLIGPLALGAVLRRNARLDAIIVGCVLGVVLRLGLSELFFGSPWYVRDSGVEFSLGSLRHTVPMYAGILLVMLPAGAFLPLLYRGPRRVELVLAVTLYVALFLFYDWDSVRGQGVLKGLVLSSRFMVPALPLLAWMAADVWPRIVLRLRGQLRLVTATVARAAAAGVVILAFMVHLVARKQETEALSIVQSIYSYTKPGPPVITNSNATLKYLSPVYGPRRLILRHELNIDSVQIFAARYGTMSIVLLDRMDSEMFRAETRDNVYFLAEVQSRCALNQTFAAKIGVNTLRILELTRCAGSGENGASQVVSW